MIKKLSKLLIGLVIATPVWANNAQDYDQRYIQWKNKQHAVFKIRHRVRARHRKPIKSA